MYEEPYRWVEAVGNRRQYLDEQFTKGAPVVALAYADGILMLTVSRGTPKLYEIYDRIALGGMGHPADLEKLRFSLLEMAHVEGFNRSPSDVTGARLMKYGLAPTIKQAFEEIYKAPFIAKILLAELGVKSERDLFLTINYDGTFEESRRWAALSATTSVQARVGAYFESQPGFAQASLGQAVEIALCAWAVGSLAQVSPAATEGESLSAPASATQPDQAIAVPPDKAVLLGHVRQTVQEKSLECILLERNGPGSSKYRALRPDELGALLPSAVNGPKAT
ncbi:MAG: putative Proteasome, alpha subunit [Nitrospira sp.]|jgi:proteasome alpha subunit|nr:putative Proteasome, alpha subunit [Nitrospira sp.]